MAAVWYPCTALLLVLNAALASAGGGRVVNFTANGTVGDIQLYANSKVFFNCTAVNTSISTIVRIKKTDLNNPQRSIDISDNDELVAGFSDPRYSNPVLHPGATSDVKSYILEVKRLEETDNSTFTCSIHNSSASVKVSVSAVPYFQCNKTVSIDRKSGNVSITCPLYAYKLQSLVAYWRYSQQGQVALRPNNVSTGSESTVFETHFNVNYTLRLLPADPDNGVPYTVSLTISPIEGVPELFKTAYHFRAKGEKGETDFEVTISDGLKPDPVHGDATKRQTWFFAAQYLVTVVLTVVFGRL